MRIKHIYISNYKNLKDFSIDFDGDSFIDVFVGKNGTGKSNLFEAIIEIFRQLYENDYSVDFEYKLEYELEGDIQYIHWDWQKSQWYNIKGEGIRKINKSHLPDNILIYYSGHNEMVTQLVDEYVLSFKKELKEANEGDTREFIGIGNEYKSLLLAVLLLQPNKCKSKQFILSKLGIAEIGNEVKIVLKRPYYARKKGYNVDRFDASTRFWKAQGITLTFLDRLNGIKHSQTEGVRDEGHIPQGEEEYKDLYKLFLDIEDFVTKLKDITPQELFRNFDNLKTIEMLNEISINIKLNDGTEIELDKFSDGQFQSIYIYTIIELFKDKNCLTLLDEPDSFLHPEWQFEFLKQIFEITEVASVNNHVLMTSHSASTISSSTESHLNLFSFDGNSITVSKIGKNRIISDLSTGRLVLSNDETIMNINTYLRNTDQPVLFTEGITDEFILDIAWKKLFPEEKRRFCIHNAFDRIFLRNLFSRGDLKMNNPHRTFFALFDFDEAYDDWNGLSKNGEDLVNDPFKGLTRKLKDVSHYAMLLPVPTIESIRRQVLNPENSPWGKGSESHLSIELLFYKGEPDNPNFILHDISGGGSIVKFSGDKVNFAKNIVPELPVNYFEIFIPMFEFIKAAI